MSSAPDPASFTFEPLFVVLAAGAAVAYVRAARVHHPGPLRIASFTAGIVLIAGSVNSPLETLAVHYLLLAHLVQNALLADVAPPLLMLGLNGAMWEALDRAVPLVPRACTNLVPALAFWLAAWYGVHFAPVYEYAVQHPIALNVEHLVLLAAGLWFWAPVVRSRWWSRSPAVLVPYLLVAFVGASFLGLAFTFVPHPFYSYYAHTPRLAGMSPAEDQNLGGIAMNSEQSVIFLIAIGYVLITLANREHAGAERRELPG